MCKGLSALQTHGRKCPVYLARRAAHVEAIESNREPMTDAEFLATYRPDTPADHARLTDVRPRG